MRRALTIAILLAASCKLLAGGTEPEPKKDSSKRFTTGMSQGHVPGTTLWRDDSYTTQPETGWTEHRCYIGFLREGVNNGKEYRQIVPVLILPPLDNDTYTIIVTSGELNVTTTKSKRSVVSINLANIAPAVLTQNQVEPAGAGQPATQPAEKSPAEVQPPTPRSKNAPR